MGRAYSDITFTPTVRDMQSAMGSREQHAFLDTMEDRGVALTPREARFIQEADHFYQATVSETGWPYVQHRGGPTGFLKVLDAGTIGFADYRGNLHYLSAGNLRTDDRISLIVVDYPNRRRLKLLGRVRLVDAREDESAVTAVRDEGYPAIVERAFIITIEGWDWNCPQHITPRFTEAEVASLVNPLREQVQRMRSQVSALKAPATPASLGDGELPLKIAGVRQLTPLIRCYELVSPDGSPLPLAQAGSHLDIPFRHEDGTPGTRCYSIASNPARSDVYEIAVLRETDGKGGSAAIHRDFAIGVLLNCSMPKNSFALGDELQRAVLVAGGVGITPIKAMAHALASKGAEFEIHYACRSRGHAPFLGQLVEAFGRQVAVYAKDENARLDVRTLIDSLSAEAQIYVCGPTSLIEAVKSCAASAGVPSNRVHVERFTAGAPRSDSHEFVIHLSKSGRDLTVPKDKTILEVLESNAIKVPSSCRIGNCGTCATRVLAGTPSHRDDILTEHERTHQGLMCICVSRAEDAELTLDI